MDKKMDFQDGFNMAINCMKVGYVLASERNAWLLFSHDGHSQSR